MPPGWPNGTGIRARTVDGSSAGVAATPGPAVGAAAGRLPRPVITARTAAAIRATATATSSRRPRGKPRFSFGSWPISSISPCSVPAATAHLPGCPGPRGPAIRRSADVLAAAAGVAWGRGKDDVMKGAVTASGRDLRTLAGIVSDDRGEPPAEGVPPSLLGDLLGLVGGDLVVFGGTDSSRQADWFDQTLPTEAHDPEFD